jgi:peptidylprolyl isomerase
LAQFTSLRWSDGGVQATTWGPGLLPETIDMTTAIPGLRLGLLDQSVGSQVLLVVPPTDGDGVDTLVIVVDILAVVHDAPTDASTIGPTDSPTPEASTTPAPSP